MAAVAGNIQYFWDFRSRTCGTCLNFIMAYMFVVNTKCFPHVRTDISLLYAHVIVARTFLGFRYMEF